METIVAQPDGTLEFYKDGALLRSLRPPAIPERGDLPAFINVEKTSNNATVTTQSTPRR